MCIVVYQKRIGCEIGALPSLEFFSVLFTMYCSLYRVVHIIYLFIYLFIHSLIYLFLHLFIHSFIHSLIYLLFIYFYLFIYFCKCKTISVLHNPFSKCTDDSCTMAQFFSSPYPQFLEAEYRSPYTTFPPQGSQIAHIQEGQQVSMTLLQTIIVLS